MTARRAIRANDLEDAQAIAADLDEETTDALIRSIGLPSHAIESIPFLMFEDALIPADPQNATHTTLLESPGALIFDACGEHIDDLVDDALVTLAATGPIAFPPPISARSHANAAPDTTTTATTTPSDKEPTA